MKKTRVVTMDKCSGHVFQVSSLTKPPQLVCEGTLFFQINFIYTFPSVLRKLPECFGHFGGGFPDPKPPFWCTNPKPVYGVSSVQQRPSRWRELLGRFDVTNATFRVVGGTFIFFREDAFVLKYGGEFPKSQALN